MRRSSCRFPPYRLPRRLSFSVSTTTICGDRDRHDRHHDHDPRNHDHGPRSHGQTTTSDATTPRDRPLAPSPGRNHNMACHLAQAVRAGKAPFHDPFSVPVPMDLFHQVPASLLLHHTLCTHHRSPAFGTGGIPAGNTRLMRNTVPAVRADTFTSRAPSAAWPSSSV